MRALVIGLMGIGVVGCTTAPVPNIIIGGEEGCPSGNVTLNVFTDIDKITTGNDSAIHDEDSGLKEPTLGL